MNTLLISFIKLAVPMQADRVQSLTSILQPCAGAAASHDQNLKSPERSASFLAQIQEKGCMHSPLIPIDEKGEMYVLLHLTRWAREEEEGTG